MFPKLSRSGCLSFLFNYVHFMTHRRKTCRFGQVISHVNDIGGARNVSPNEETSENPAKSVSTHSPKIFKWSFTGSYLSHQCLFYSLNLRNSYFDDAVRLHCSFHVLWSLLLRRVARLSYEPIVVLIQLWKILVVFEGTLRLGAISSSPVVYCLSQFLFVLFRPGFLIERVLWFLFLSLQVIYATSKYNKWTQHLCVIITKSPCTSLPEAVKSCPPAACTSWRSSSSVETQDR